jgi:hypothetical protein
MTLKSEGPGFKIYEDESTQEKPRLIVELDHTRKGVPSKSGKSQLVINTGGFIKLGDGLSISINLIKQ